MGEPVIEPEKPPQPQATVTPQSQAPPVPEEPTTAKWTVEELTAGGNLKEEFILDGKALIIRPIVSHELAQINRAFEGQPMENRMAGVVHKCIVEPAMTFDQAKSMLPGHLQRTYMAIMDISGYTERSRKNLSG